MTTIDDPIYDISPGPVEVSVDDVDLSGTTERTDLSHPAATLTILAERLANVHGDLVNANNALANLLLQITGSPHYVYEKPVDNSDMPTLARASATLLAIDALSANIRKMAHELEGIA